MLEQELPDVVKETSFKFGEDSLKNFFKANGIEENHHVIFDEVICSKFSKEFLNCLTRMKSKVASLWIAMGAKPSFGPFPIESFERCGFECPQLSYALRNPLNISEYAQKVIQDRGKNLLDGVLQNPINMSEAKNIVEGQLIKINKKHSSCEDAIVSALLQVPEQKFALAFINSQQMSRADIFDVSNAFSSRPKQPLIFIGSDYDEDILMKWLCQPWSRGEGGLISESTFNLVPP